ncbi:MafI family immunity protein [Streptomyces sp. NPDC001393]
MSEVFNAVNREASWDRARNALEAAAALLAPGESSEALVEFRDFIARNELELAFDELVAIGDDLELDIRFWLLLDSAAREMRLYSAALDVPHLTSADLCRRHIAVHSESSA